MGYCTVVGRARLSRYTKGGVDTNNIKVKGDPARDRSTTFHYVNRTQNAFIDDMILLLAK